MVDPIKKACDFLGIPLVFETDDDYLHLPPSNPAYLAMISKDQLKKCSTPGEVEALRRRGLEEYKYILGLMDGVTVSTEELKRTLNPYNKNIKVLQNNVPQLWGHRDNNPEEHFRDPENPGKLNIRPNFRLWSIPNYYSGENAPVQVPRIGYSCTVSHRGDDFDTVSHYWEKLIEKYSGSLNNTKQSQMCWYIYLGDKDFWDQHDLIKKNKNLHPRNIFIPPDQYDLYMFNYRNLDIAIAPLTTNIFNMAKSDIKAVEAASWGIPSVLPDYITYTRNFKHGETCLTYRNGREFMECVEALINDPYLRLEIGTNARNYIKESRLEHLHAQERLDFYKSLIDNSYRLKIFGGNNGTKECATV